MYSKYIHIKEKIYIIILAKFKIREEKYVEEVIKNVGCS